MDERRGAPTAIRAAFGETVDPSRHVPRPATEAVLERLEAFCRNASPSSPLATLVVPPGFGRTHLLRVLEERLIRGSNSCSSSGHAAVARAVDDRTSAPSARASVVLYLPYAALSLDDLIRWVEGLLGAHRSDLAGDFRAPQPAVDWPSRRVTTIDATLVLLIDDADSMPEATVRGLAQVLPREAEALRIVLALSDDSRAVRLLAALERVEPIEIHFSAALDASETEAYLRARLAGAGLEASLLDDLDPVTVARIRALSGGIPRRVHRVATALLEPEREALARALALHSRSHAWLGAPLVDPL